MKLFGGPKKRKDVTPVTVISKLQETLEILEKKQDYLEKKSENQLVEAKQFMKAKNKKGALICLKRKKAFEEQWNRFEGMKLNIEQQMMTLDECTLTSTVMEAMRMGSSALKSVHEGMSMDTVDQTMDDIQDQMVIAEDLNSALSQPLGMDLFDEDELLKSLEEELELEKELNPVNSSASAAPTEEEEEEEKQAREGETNSSEEVELEGLLRSLA